MNLRETRGLIWLAVAVGVYIAVAIVVVVAMYARHLEFDKSFWDGVIGNLMASLIEALALGVVAAGALWVFERKRWGYARNLARARLVNSISIAWNAVAGRYDPNPSPVIYHFDGVTTDVGPDFKALMAPSQVLTPDKIGEARQRSRKYEYQADPNAFAEELTTLSSTLATVVETLENTLALFGNQCGPELWLTALKVIEEIKQFRKSLSGPGSKPEGDVSVQTAVIVASLAQAGAVITRNIPLESPEAYQERLFKEAMEGFEKFRKTLDDVKK